MRDQRQLDVAAHALTRGTAAISGAWLLVLRRYLLAIVLGNLVWELAQLPLYTIWVLFAALHCAAGDVLIASAALLACLLVPANGSWPYWRYWVSPRPRCWAGLPTRSSANGSTQRSEAAGHTANGCRSYRLSAPEYRHWRSGWWSQ
jgi:hypothetical protein